MPIFNDETGTYGCFAFPPGGAVYFFDRDITKKLPCVSAGLPKSASNQRLFRAGGLITRALLLHRHYVLKMLFQSVHVIKDVRLTSPKIGGKRPFLGHFYTRFSAISSPFCATLRRCLDAL